MDQQIHTKTPPWALKMCANAHPRDDANGKFPWKRLKNQGRGPGGPLPPLIFRPNGAPKCRKFFWGDRPPHLSKGLDDSPPPPPHPLSQGLDRALNCKCTQCLSVNSSRSRSRKRSRKSAYDLVKNKNRSRKRSHKGDGIRVRRIRTFPFSSDSAYDSVAYVPLMI